MSLYPVAEGRGLMAPGTTRERKRRRWIAGTEEGSGFKMGCDWRGKGRKPAGGGLHPGFSWRTRLSHI